MNKKKLLFGMIFCFFGMSLMGSAMKHAPAKHFRVLAPFYWLYHKTFSKNQTRTVMYETQQVPEVIELPIVHSFREVTFVNNLGELFDALKDDPYYRELPNLIDQNIIVNGKTIMPGTSSTLLIEDNHCIVTINLYQGMVKIIYAMQQGVLKGILMKLLKHIEPWLQWQYTFACHINEDLDSINLSDVVLSAYNQAQDLGSVNTQFSFSLLVKMALNQPIDV